MRLFLSFLLLSCICFASFAETSEQFTFKSGASPINLVELYTSEGCSSCPPADRWMSSLAQHPDLWTRFVPVALHVDYWNYLGWHDRFANKHFSQRQQHYAQRFSEPTVYTPGIRLAGFEWRGWRRSNAETQVSRQQKENVGVLTLNYQKNGSFSAQFVPLKKAAKNYRLAFVLLGSGLKTEVRRGENQGRTLQHDFVVLEMLEQEMINEGDAYYAKGTIALSNHKAETYSVAAWVSEQDDIVPIQAVGGDL